MSSLFAKIFLWFWLAITIIIAALALVTWLYPVSVAPGGMLPDRLHELQVRGALAVWELRGADAYEEHRRQLESASRLRTYIIDDKGVELSGNAVPKELLEFAAQNQSAIDEGRRISAGQPSRLAIPMTGGDGRKYLALVERSRSMFARGPVPGERPMFTPRDGRDGREGPASRPGVPTSISPDGLPRSTPSDRPGDRRFRSDGGDNGGSRSRGGPAPAAEPAPRFELLVPPHVVLLRLGAVVLAAGLGCYLLARYLTSPVRQLQDAARRLAAGDFTTRVGKRLATRRDEIGVLGREFDRMAGQVDGLISTQKRLLRDVSHELRSPLARMNVALELASRDAGPAAAPALARVGLEAERLNELIGQLLALARLEAEAVQAQHSSIDLRALVGEVVADANFEATAYEKRVRIGRSEACQVEGDPSLLRSAIENVVRNAAHHTAVHSDVEVTLAVKPAETGSNRACIEVRDHGPGVPEDALQRIFDPFYRVSDARERRSGGVGLGLAITKRAITVHAGEVIASNAPDGGLIVRITLPTIAMNS